MKSKYCRKCGRKLIWKQDSAEKELDPFFRHFDKYNAETGEQQFVGWWECPKSHWWNSHDSYMAELV